ncbi:very long chain fatty acid elongase 5 [Petromyzon marinus]|uniref:Elongation of very long chain fatty acids protein n=1 Tax=Petromyzon marinus TaxID=7757 RepID=A0AAJ7TGX5_PETMA|nr:elongation of very long chain fatty acids protein 5-like [Petromyzon marinus]
MEALDTALTKMLDDKIGPRDPRIRGWLLLDSYLPTLVSTLVYLLVVAVGPKLMRERQPFSLKGLLVVYNALLTALSFYMFYELVAGVWTGGYNLRCQNTHSAGEADMRIARVLWIYYLSKLIEFLDTVFFIVRKKNTQVTVLHVYHHASMPTIWWFVLNWVPCGHSYFGATFNCFIHVLMYGYYGLSVIPAMRPYLWWKRYITQAQLTQFVMTMVQSGSAIVMPCGFPAGWLWFQISYMMSLVLLFSNFYIQTYIKQGSRPKLESHANGKMEPRSSGDLHENGNSTRQRKPKRV